MGSSFMFFLQEGAAMQLGIDLENDERSSTTIYNLLRFIELFVNWFCEFNLCPLWKMKALLRAEGLRRYIASEQLTACSAFHLLF